MIVQANYWANRYGLDTISLGGTIAACIELYELVKSQGEAASQQEKQLLEDMQEFVEQYGQPAFGNANILIPFVHEIGNLRGIGKYLALGSYRFCERYGHPGTLDDGQKTGDTRVMIHAPPLRKPWAMK